MLIDTALAQPRHPGDVEAVVGAHAVPLEAVLVAVAAHAVVVDVALPDELANGPADFSAGAGHVLMAEVIGRRERGGEEEGGERDGLGELHLGLFM